MPEESKNNNQEQPKKKSKKWIWIIVALFALIAIVSAGGDGEQEASNSTDAPDNSFVWASSEVTQENVMAALLGKSSISTSIIDDNFPEGITEINIINVSENAKNVMVYFTAGDFWDETDFVKKIGGTAIYAGNILFDNPNVNQIGLFAATEMIDQYGNSKLETVAKIIIDRNTAEKINWEGIADMHITDPGNIYRIANDYNIHLGILKNVKLDEVRMQ